MTAVEIPAGEIMESMQIKTARLIASMRPALVEGEFVYATTTDMRGTDLGEVSCVFHENEGTTVICSRDWADRNGVSAEGSFRQITLTVHSPLQAVGFLAAVSNALSRAGIACNAISAFYHDHLFVPSEQAPRALEIISDLSERARSSIQTEPSTS